MKKMNKKGFTLAELLIVVAIIAILIAIAIPAFGGALNNAKIQTDHANIRSAYAIAQAGTLQGVIYTGKDGATETTVASMAAATTAKYYFMQDGTIQASTDTGFDINKAYRLKATPSDASACAASICCSSPTGNAHTVNNYIYLTAADGKVTVNVNAS